MTRTRILTRFALTLCAATALTLSPVSPVGSLFGQDGQAFAKGKSGSHGNSGSHGGGASTTSHGKSGTRGNSGTHGQGGTHGKSGHGGSSDDTAIAAANDAAGEEMTPPLPAVRPHKNLHAELARLNSLKRNINGLMNSSDPHMDGIRDFIRASAESDQLLSAIADAEQAASDANDSLNAYLDQLLTGNGLDPANYGDVTVDGIQAELDALNAAAPAEDDPAYADWLAETESLSNVLDTLENDPQYQTLLEGVDAASGELASLQDQMDGLGDTGDEGLKEALAMAANQNRLDQEGDAYFSPELMDWARQILGVGDYQGLIDAYEADQVPVEETADTGA